MSNLSGRDFNINSTIKLQDGVEMPLLGLGVYEMNDAQTEQSVMWALEAGYRLIDTAEWYENERAAGKAIRDFLAKYPSVPRSALFYETKLKYNLGRDKSQKAFLKSMEECELEYVDLYLLHSPLGGPKMRRESWDVALDAKRSGLVRSVGVSNFGIEHLREIVEHRPREEWPSVNQIDLHPFMTHEKLVEYCKEHSIVLQAWAPLVRSMRFNHPTIAALEKKYQKTPAQILLRWSLQKGYAPIPKSIKQARIVENTKIFGWELSQEDMAALGVLNENLLTDWDVTTVE